MTRWDEQLEQAELRFARSALEQEMVDVATINVATPIGELLVASAGDSIVRIAFDVEDHDLVLAELAAAIAPRVVEVETRTLAAARQQLDEYFAGTRTAFDLPLDLRLARGPFRREVLGHLQQIPVGQTRTYAELAVIAGRPRAVRAVGSGCATNPVPVVIPCHRVLRTGGALGGYLGGTRRKQWLLDHEHAMLVA